MSVGNINSYGDKKNNFPFQYKVLKGLGDVVTTLISGITVTVSNAINIQTKLKTTVILRPNSASSLIAGYNSVSIANVGTGNGTVKGVVIKPGETVTFNAGAVNNTLDAIAYSATGTEFLIVAISPA